MSAKITALLIILISAFTLTAQNIQHLKPDLIIEATYLGESKPLSEATAPAVAAPSKDLPPYEIVNFRARINHGPVERNTNPQIDPLWRPNRQYSANRTPSASLLLNQNGIGNTGVSPPDPVADAGINHIMQAVNGFNGTNFRVYNKNGTSASSQGTFNQFWSQFGVSGLGDPIIIFDNIANRWVLTEFASSGSRLLIAVSTTDDPLGTYNSYMFNTQNFPDYPKYSVWPNAYYVTTNENSSAFYAIERSAMLVGGPATMQRFSVNNLPNFGFQSLTPVSFSGDTMPAANTIATFWRHVDDEAHFPGSSDPFSDYVQYWELTPDFAQPNNSVLSGPFDISVSEFDSDLNGYFNFSAIKQPNSSVKLDPLREVFMNRMQYRNFGPYESIVGVHVTDLDGNDNAGMRWYEFRKTGNSGWKLFQEGTYGPDLTSRWMGAISINKFGTICLAYSVSDNSSVFPGLRFTGRTVGDSTGMMTLPEQVIVNGSAPNNGNRYGDYASMFTDPVDDLTFWFTGEYNPSPNWSTRIAHIQLLDPCDGLTAYATIDASSLICGNSNGGIIELTGFAGLGGTYEFSDDGVNFQTSGIFSGLTAGEHYFTVRQGSCTSLVGPIVLEPANGMILNAQANPITCFGDTDGQIDLSASGGFGNLLYSIDSVNWTANSLFINLPGGMYTTYVRDDSNCVESEPVEVVDPGEIQFTTDITNVSASGTPDGEFVVHATMGNPGYTFSIDNNNFQTDSLFTNLLDLTYTVYIKDQKNCEAQGDVQITVTGITSLFPESSYRIYPNPTEGEFVLEVDELIGRLGYSVKLNDVTGKLIEQREMAAQSGVSRVSFNLSDYAHGVYLLHLINEEGESTIKILRK